MGLRYINVNGPTKVAGTGQALGRSVTVAAAKKFFYLMASNQAAATRYLQLFDATSLPANGTYPFATTPVAAGAPASIVYPLGRTLDSGGVVAALSSTSATLTIVVADEAILDVNYD